MNSQIRQFALRAKLPMLGSAPACSVLIIYVVIFCQSHDNYGPLCPPHFCEVFDRCLLKNPDARPSFKEIRKSLVAKVSLSGDSHLFRLLFLLLLSQYGIGENKRCTIRSLRLYKHKLENQLKKQKGKEERKNQLSQRRRN